MATSIQFLGGAGTVTGSKFLVSDGKDAVLIDCGLFQGIKELRLLNWSPFPVPPESITAVILTHAHLDHTGYLPLLVKCGFSGKVYCTAATRDLTRIILNDSAKIQEEDAENANRMGYSKHHPARPLYFVEDAKAALKNTATVDLGKWTSVTENIKFRFEQSGHILGSAFVELMVGGEHFVFSGDLGRAKPLLLKAPAVLEKADYVIIESTYGDRVHAPNSPLKELRQIVNDTVSRKGHLIIPSFALGRVQDLLFLLQKLKSKKEIPNIPVFLDSPMGIDATEVFFAHPEWHSLKPNEVKAMGKVATLVKGQQQSLELARRKESSIVIAGSGMLSGGRVLRHLETRLSDKRNTVLLVGFQAAGTRGRLLKDGIPELKIYGNYIPVKAKVEEISTLSAHADQRETISWLKNFRKPPKMTFIVHGEPQASDALRVRIKDSLGWETCVAHPMQQFQLK